MKLDNFTLRIRERYGVPLDGKHVLIIVENLPLPFDRRVWQEARTLLGLGAHVSVICPKAKGYENSFETISGIDIYRHSVFQEGRGAWAYLREYLNALFWEFSLALKIYRRRPIDVIHGCNPPDLIFLVALPFKLVGTKYIFDHHDICPELFEAKFARRGVLWRVMLWFERMTFMSARVSIATNESYKAIAEKRGKMKSENVFVVRSGPDIARLTNAGNHDTWKNGRRHLVGYVGVMGEQEGIDILIETISYIVHTLGRKDIQFVLVGGGPELDRIKRLADEQRLARFVTITGRAPDNVLFEVLSTMDLGVNPDRVNQMNNLSTMNKVLEYMAFSKPQVQFDVIEGRNSAGNTSLYAKPNDPIDFAEKILELLSDSQRARSMGENARRRVEEELSWEFQIPALRDAYLRALSIR